MIRINLLDAERRRARSATTFDTGWVITAVCALILIATGLVVGWWHWSFREESLRVDRELAAGQQEVARLQSLVGTARELEQQRARLQERVALIDQLRRGQSIPVRLLDHVSRSLPGMLWLTSMEQEAGQITIEGHSTALIALSDFVGNLEVGELLQAPVEIVNSQVEPAIGSDRPATPELIQFTVRARISQPSDRWP